MSKQVLLNLLTAAIAAFVIFACAHSYGYL
jgi:hypothetical protein